MLFVASGMWHVAQCPWPCPCPKTSVKAITLNKAKTKTKTKTVVIIKENKGRQINKRQTKV